jgi:hypothetical protein
MKQYALLTVLIKNSFANLNTVAIIVYVYNSKRN